jgi:hypothetical protein
MVWRLALCSLCSLHSLYLLAYSGAGASPGVTFSGLLNAIDGAAAQEGRMLFMTTNHIEKVRYSCMPYSYCTHAVLLLYSYCPVLLLYSCCILTVLLLYSYCTPTVFLLYSCCTHTHNCVLYSPTVLRLYSPTVLLLYSHTVLILCSYRTPLQAGSSADSTGEM